MMTSCNLKFAALWPSSLGGVGCGDFQCVTLDNQPNTFYQLFFSIPKFIVWCFIASIIWSLFYSYSHISPIWSQDVCVTQASSAIFILARTPYTHGSTTVQMDVARTTTFSWKISSSTPRTVASSCRSSRLWGTLPARSTACKIRPEDSQPTTLCHRSDPSAWLRGTHDSG